MSSMKRQIFLFAGALFCLFSAWYAWWIRPQQVELDTAEQQIRGLIRRVEAATAERTRLAQVQQEISTLDAEVKQMESRLFERPQLPEILRQIAGLGGRYGLKFSAIYPKYDELLQAESSQGEPLLVLPVEIQVDGEFVKFGQFIELLDRQQFLFSVQRLDMSITRDSYPYVRVTVQGNLFLRRTPGRVQVG